MTRPIQTLLWMSIFTIIIATGAFLLSGALHEAYISNTVFNSIIVSILLIGIVINFRQVIQLNPEIDWIVAYKNNTHGLIAVQPKLLSSMARLLEGKEELTLSTNSMQTILESIRTRLEDSRDLSRYLIGVLVFLGLLGTFWGLMSTVSAVGTMINEMSVEAVSGAEIFANLKNSLAGPLSGMGVAFSSSLFGLAGSLILGFLDLQAGQAQNRFYHETEEWLASMTVVSADQSDGVPQQNFANMTELTQTLANIAHRMEQGNTGMVSQSGTNIADTLEAMVNQMRAEQKVVRQWIDEQANQNSEMRHLMAELMKTRGR